MLQYIPSYLCILYIDCGGAVEGRSVFRTRELFSSAMTNFEPKLNLDPNSDMRKLFELSAYTTIEVGIY